MWRTTRDTISDDLRMAQTATHVGNPKDGIGLGDVNFSGKPIYVECYQRETRFDFVALRANPKLFQLCQHVAHLNSSGKPLDPKKITVWSYDVQGHAEQLRRKILRARWQNFLPHRRSSRRCAWTTTRFLLNTAKLDGGFYELFSRIMLKCLFVSGASWKTRFALDAASLVHYINRGKNCPPCCFVGNNAEDCKLGVFAKYNYLAAQNQAPFNCSL